MTFKISKLKNCINLQGILLPFVLFSIFAFWQTALAQDDLDLENMEINTAETYEAANSITAGSGFTILSTGEVTFKSGKYVYLRPGFTVLSGGTFNVMLDEHYGPVSEDISQILVEFRLGQNYPNPFNPVTTIGYRLSAVSEVELTVYNLIGQKVGEFGSEKQNAGSYQVEWDANRFSSGLYIITRLQPGIT